MIDANFRVCVIDITQHRREPGRRRKICVMGLGGCPGSVLHFGDLRIFAYLLVASRKYFQLRVTNYMGDFCQIYKKGIVVK